MQHDNNLVKLHPLCAIFTALSSSLSMIQLLWRNPIIIIIIKLHSVVCCVKPIHWEDIEVIGGNGAKSRRAIGRKSNASNSLENYIFKNVSANISGSQWFRGTLHTDASYNTTLRNSLKDKCKREKVAGCIFILQNRWLHIAGIPGMHRFRRSEQGRWNRRERVEEMHEIALL